MICVIYSTKSRPSAKVLTTSLRQYTGEVIHRGLPSLKKLRTTQYDVVLNVGNSTPFTAAGTPPVVNAPKYIRTSANKKAARIRFKAKGISAPKLWLSPAKIPAYEFPVVGRTTYHMKGQGFWYCLNRAAAVEAAKAGATHFIKFIRNTREFRAHVFATRLSPSSIKHYVVAKLSEKRMSETTDTDIIKNHEHGYKFLAPKKMSPDMEDEILTLAKQAIYKFRLHYGGVDIVYSLTTHKAYILEINTTPCLTDTASNTLEIYTQHLTNMIGVARHG